MKPVTVGDLPDQNLLRAGNHPELHCFECGGSYSADKDDYFMHPKDHVFACCDKPIALVVKEVRFVPFKR